MASPTSASLTACVIVVVLAAGCGDGDGGDASAPDTTTTTGAAQSSSTATTTTAVPEKDLTATSRVRLDGIGPIVMGMTLDEATAAVGRTVAVVPESFINDEDTDTCGFAAVEGGPEGMRFMVNRDRPGEEWTIVRLDVGGESSVSTGAGIKVGSSEDDVKRAYEQRIKTEPHQYTADEGGHYMILDVDGAGGMRLLFETDGEKVLTYRSGFEGAVDAPEGCA